MNIQIYSPKQLGFVVKKISGLPNARANLHNKQQDNQSQHHGSKQSVNTELISTKSDQPVATVEETSSGLSNVMIDEIRDNSSKQTMREEKLDEATIEAGVDSAAISSNEQTLQPVEGQASFQHSSSASGSIATDRSESVVQVVDEFATDNMEKSQVKPAHINWQSQQVIKPADTFKSEEMERSCNIAIKR